uniref:Uncharacterized protein n=1 Tax=Chenopodium quinoa TaxID=63459 RepID=A0A803NDR0_CHEQI
MQTDVRKNSVKVDLETIPGVESVYEGGAAETVGESREKAAEDAVRSLRIEYSVQVEDLTSKEICKLERCEFLYQMKRIELESVERAGSEVPVKWPSVPNQRSARNMSVLTTQMFCAFLLWRLKHVFQKLRLSKLNQGSSCHGLQFMPPQLLLEWSALSALSMPVLGLPSKMQLRRLYLAAKERVLGIQGALHLAPFLGEDGCVTPKSAVHKIPSPALPPPPPHKPRARSSFGACYGSQPSPAPAELDAFFKRRKLD